MTDENVGITFETNTFMKFQTKSFIQPTYSKKDYDRFFKIYVKSDRTLEK